MKFKIVFSLLAESKVPVFQDSVIEIALGHGCSPVNLLHIFRAPSPKNTSGWLLLLLILE